jgi:DNA-directed RNA polymerase subunit RPC12/RpoP
MDNEFIVEFECPQCGAPASLEETSRLFVCEYCTVKSYLVPQEVYHFVLPSRAPQDKDIIYFPYWRLKGVLFICEPHLTVYTEPIDLIYQAAPSDFFPRSLGFKTHVMKMRFAGPDLKGRIFKPTIPLHDIVAHMKYEYEIGYKQQYETELAFYHAEFVGLLEIIYAPFYIHESTLYDGISNERVDMFRHDPIHIDEELMAALPPEECLNQDVKFMPTLCPHCGWDMDCAKDSYLLACKNCSSFYKPRQGKVKKLGVGFIPRETNTALFLPFWRLKADVKGIQLTTFGDLIKVANLIKVVSGNDKQRQFYFWIPAFKIASKLFLQIATHVTLCQPQGKFERSMPDVPMYPVNLPISEAIKCPKTVIANFIAFKDIHFPKLHQFEITPKRLALIYLPFQAYGSEFVHPDFKVRVTNKTLEHFRE